MEKIRIGIIGSGGMATRLGLAAETSVREGRRVDLIPES